MKFARHMDRIQTSPSAVMSQKAREMKAEGMDVIALSSGQPDFPTPAHIVEAAHAAVLRGETKYTTISGSAELKDMVVEKFKRENGLHFSRDEIIIGNGSKQVIFNALLAGTDIDEEVILPAPYYVAYIDMIKFTGGKAVIVPCGVDQGFKLTPAQLEAAITPKSRWLLLNSPNNPTGAVYDAAELRALADVLLRHPHVGVIMDDIYEHITFDGVKFSTMVEIEPALRDRTVTANGVSKSYAMTGWRVGYAAAPAAMIQQMTKLQSLVTSGASSVGQAAAIAALSGPQGFIAEQAKSFEDRRDLVVSMINQTTGLSCPTPKGAFYVYPSCAGVLGKKTPAGAVIENDRDFVLYLLETENVATVHGGAYGISPHFRISYASSTEELIEACERIQRACAALS
ncbi:MAG: pyridoxal phosphate-dependent aminotransferase [Proteobacteria bacterium]|nr:pyridoxal phosphate-dependent aminotransferase [Pseudomonadota bacterium]MDA1308008.1 pyridoxal phosphate-dependent aminotransferase [Pseudomonadota bacterium]